MRSTGKIKGLEDWESKTLHDMAEHAVMIPEGEKVGGWTRDMRVAVIYSVLVSIYKINKKRMRQIKFRIYNASKGVEKMLDWEFAKQLRMDETIDSENVNNSHLRVMEFTGLKDTKGKDIYEGDIVEWSIFTDAQDLAEGESEEKRIRDVVAFGNGCWKVEKRCEILGLKEPYRKLKVVGNIYQNPELIK